MTQIGEVKLSTSDIQSAQMEVLCILTAGIAHEINSPAQLVGDHLKFIEDSIKQIMTGRGDLTDLIKENLPIAIKNTIAGVNRISSIIATMRRLPTKVLIKDGTRGH
jgi:hypothetical protein